MLEPTILLILRPVIEELVKLTDPFWTERLVEVIEVPEALTKFRFKIVPTVVKLGNEVEAEIARKVEVAKAG